MSETKKEAFRKYLESAGAIDNLTRVLVSLYEEQERPKDALDYIKSSLGAPTPEQYDSILAEKEKLSSDLTDAKKEIEEMKAKIADLEAAAVSTA